GHRRVADRADRIGAGVGDQRVGDQRRVAAGGGDGDDLRLARAGADARQGDDLRRGRVLVGRRGAGGGVGRGGLVDRQDRDREGTGERVDAAVGGAAVVLDGDDDDRRAEDVGVGRVGQRARGVGADVVDRRVGDQRRVAAGGGDRQVLRLVGP